MITTAKLPITQHKRFVPIFIGTHPNPSTSLRTSFMLGTLAETLDEAFLECGDAIFT